MRVHWFPMHLKCKFLTRPLRLKMCPYRAPSVSSVCPSTKHVSVKWHFLVSWIVPALFLIPVLEHDFSFTQRFLLYAVDIFYFLPTICFSDETFPGSFSLTHLFKSGFLMSRIIYLSHFCLLNRDIFTAKIFNLFVYLQIYIALIPLDFKFHLGRSYVFLILHFSVANIWSVPICRCYWMPTDMIPECVISPEMALKNDR